MSTTVKSVDLDGGGSVLVEVEDHTVAGGDRRIGMGHAAGKTFEVAWQSVMPIMTAVGNSLAESGVAEAQVKFGVKLSSDLDAIIASASGEANFEVTLTWKHASAK